MVRSPRHWQEENEDQEISGLKMTMENKETGYALCVDNKDCEDLEKRKIYQVLPDDDAKQEGYLRVVDESGEDYLYPESYFVPIQLPREAQEALSITA